MSVSRIWLFTAAAAVVLHASARPMPVMAQSQAPSAPQARTSATPEQIARGKYIVEEEVQCWRCHSPLDAHGQRDRNQWLMGGPVDLKSIWKTSRSNEPWAVVAPRIGGRPAGTDDDFVRLMMTGVSRRGTLIRQPMPRFNMTHDDAVAVLAYLKTVNGKAPQAPPARTTSSPAPAAAPVAKAAIR